MLICGGHTPVIVAHKYALLSIYLHIHDKTTRGSAVADKKICCQVNKADDVESSICCCIFCLLVSWELIVADNCLDGCSCVIMSSQFSSTNTSVVDNYPANMSTFGGSIQE